MEQAPLREAADDPVGVETDRGGLLVAQHPGERAAHPCLLAEERTERLQLLALAHALAE